MVSLITKIKALNISSYLYYIYFILLIAFLILSIRDFIQEGPAVAINKSADFAPIYLASSAWTKGINPYNYDNYHALWVDAGGAPNRTPTQNVFPSVYPLTTFLFVAPLSLLAWSNASLIWIIINCSALLGILIVMIMLTGLKKSYWCLILFLAISFDLNPVHASVKMGQPTILAIFFGVLSIWIATLNQYRLSGIALAIGLSLKPICVIPFFIYYLFKRKWITITMSIVVMLLIIFITIFRIGFHDFSWITSWQDNLQIAFQEGGVNDASEANPRRNQLVNLQALLYPMIVDHNEITAIILILFLLFNLISLLLANNKNDNIYNIIVLSVISIINLLTSYHRSYDAIILILPLAVALSNVADKKNVIYSIIILFTIYPFVIRNSRITTYFIKLITSSELLLPSLFSLQKICSLLILLLLLTILMFLKNNNKI